MKKTAHHKKIKVVKKEGFFQSPLVQGLMNLLPIVLMALGVLYLGNNLRAIVFDQQVLGVESIRSEGVKIEKRERIRELREVLSSMESEKVKEEITRLESL